MATPVVEQFDETSADNAQLMSDKQIGPQQVSLPFLLWRTVRPEQTPNGTARNKSSGVQSTGGTTVVGGARSRWLGLWTSVRALSKHEVLYSRNESVSHISIVRSFSATLSVTNADGTTAQQGGGAGVDRKYSAIKKQTQESRHQKFEKSNRNNNKWRHSAGHRG